MMAVVSSKVAVSSLNSEFKSQKLVFKNQYPSFEADSLTILCGCLL